VLQIRVHLVRIQIQTCRIGIQIQTKVVYD
jgi:hypothetical protein